MSRDKKIKALITKANNINKLDLSVNEDLVLGIMNLVSIEEHLFHTHQKTKNPKYLTILNEVRIMRTDLLKQIITDYEGEVWCISKHLLAASMRLMEVGTKHLKLGENQKAEQYFDNSYSLYALFWNINQDQPVKTNSVQLNKPQSNYLNRIKSLVNQAISCCKE